MTDERGQRDHTESETSSLPDGGTPVGEWADVQLTDPDEDTWDVDVHVERGEVRTVVLRVHDDGLPGVVGSLLSDVDEEHVRSVLRRVVDRQGIDPATIATDE